MKNSSFRQTVDRNLLAEDSREDQRQMKIYLQSRDPLYWNGDYRNRMRSAKGLIQ